MGLFRKKAPLSTTVRADWATAEDWREAWDPPLNLTRGESRYMAAFAKLCGPTRENGYLIPVNVVFQREPGNRYDRNALRAMVYTPAGGWQHVGYMAKEVAAQIAPMLDRHKLTSHTCCGVIRGGSRRAENFGVHVWLDERPEPGLAISADGPASDFVEVEVSWPPGEDEGR